MDTAILEVLEGAYGWQCLGVTAAPRGFVAETYRLETSKGSCFCKMTDKRLFIPKIKRSLPVLEALYQKEFTRLCVPQRTQDSRLWLEIGSWLVVVFNYIPAKQSMQYDEWAFGYLLGQLHQVKLGRETAVPTFDFDYDNHELFERYFEDVLDSTHTDEIALALQRLIQRYEVELRQDWEWFRRVRWLSQGHQFQMVLTHGDAPGNTLMKSPTDLYLVDWDDVLLAPAERDTWFLDHNDRFMAGYYAAVPHFEPDPLARRFMIYQRYFDDIVEYCAEILGDYPAQHRRENLHKLEHNCFEGWERAAVRSLDP